MKANSFFFLIAIKKCHLTAKKKSTQGCICVLKGISYRKKEELGDANQDMLTWQMDHSELRVLEKNGHRKSHQNCAFSPATS